MRSRLRAAIARACQKNPTAADAKALRELRDACDVYFAEAWRFTGGSRQYGNVVDGLSACATMANVGLSASGEADRKRSGEAACRHARHAFEGIPATEMIYQIDLRLAQRYLA